MDLHSLREALDELRAFAFKGESGYLLLPSKVDPKVSRWRKVGEEVIAAHTVSTGEGLFPSAQTIPAALRQRLASIDHAKLTPSQASAVSRGIESDEVHAYGWATWAKLNLGRHSALTLGGWHPSEIPDDELKGALSTVAGELKPYLRVGLATRPRKAAQIREQGRWLSGRSPRVEASFDGEYIRPGNKKTDYQLNRERLEDEGGISGSSSVTHPIYGAAVLEGPPGRPGELIGLSISSYGETLALLHPEILSRTTFTEGDSLNNGDFEPHQVGPLSAALLAAAGYNHYGGPSTAMTHADDRDYPEAQVLGGVSLKDVQAFTATRNIKDDGGRYLAQRVAHHLGLK